MLEIKNGKLKYVRWYNVCHRCSCSLSFHLCVYQGFPCCKTWMHHIKWKNSVEMYLLFWKKTQYQAKRTFFSVLSFLKGWAIGYLSNQNDILTWGLIERICLYCKIITIRVIQFTTCAFFYNAFISIILFLQSLTTSGAPLVVNARYVFVSSLDQELFLFPFFGRWFY